MIQASLLAEYRELVSRLRIFLIAIVLMLIAGAILAVAAGQIFVTFWTVVFTDVRNIIDRQAARIKVAREVEG